MFHLYFLFWFLPKHQNAFEHNDENFKYKDEYFYYRESSKVKNRLIDEANEYKFPTSYTIKKPDKYFLLVKKYS